MIKPKSSHSWCSLGYKYSTTSNYSAPQSKPVIVTAIGKMALSTSRNDIMVTFGVDAVAESCSATSSTATGNSKTARMKIVTDDAAGILYVPACT